MDNLTKNDLLQAGEFARRKVPEIYLNCGDIADYVEAYLIDTCGLPYTGNIVNDYGVIHVRVKKGPSSNDTVKHFIFRIKGKHVEGYHPDTWVWVDAAFDQFNDQRKENNDWDFSYGKKESIESVRILRTETDKRMEQYVKPGNWMA